MPEPLILFDQAEADILQRLAPLAAANPAISIQLAPENHSDYERTYGKPQVWVLLESEQAESRIDAGLMVQDTTLTVIVTVQAKKLRGADGARYLEQLVRNRLLGFRPSNYEKLQYVETRTDFDDNVWSLYLAFQTRGVVQEAEAPDPLATLQQINYVTEDDPNWLGVPDPDYQPPQTEPE